MAKIISYNVNGIRAAVKKGFLDWLKAANPDVLCIQETKAHPEQLELSLFEELGYHHYWFSAEKKGYSGVAIFSKTKPNHIEYGCEIDIYDNEGRVIRADFDEFSVISVYMPSGSSGDVRQAFKIKWLEDFQLYIEKLRNKKPKLIIAGDFNICHQSIDIHNPIRNEGTSGFTKEERSWVSQFLDSGFIDSFRYFNPNPHHYSWWSYRARAREKNLGWRIDYIMASQELESSLQSAAILAEAMHSDHCPVVLHLER